MLELAAVASDKSNARWLLRSSLHQHDQQLLRSLHRFTPSVFGVVRQQQLYRAHYIAQHWRVTGHITRHRSTLRLPFLHYCCSY
jgi:hypothetical protein